MRENRVVLQENIQLGVMHFLFFQITGLNSQEFLVLSTLFSLFGGWEPDQRLQCGGGSAVTEMKNLDLAQTLGEKRVASSTCRFD